MQQFQVDVNQGRSSATLTKMLQDSHASTARIPTVDAAIEFSCCRAEGTEPRTAFAAERRYCSYLVYSTYKLQQPQVITSNA